MMKRFSFALLLASAAALIIGISAVAVSVSASYHVALPRHVAHITSDQPVAEALAAKSTVVLGIVSDVANTASVPGEAALLESFVNASMKFVTDSDVKFFAVSSAPDGAAAAAAAEEGEEISDRPTSGGAGNSAVPKPLATWIGKAFEKYYRNGVHHGIFILRRAEGQQPARMWKDWAEANENAKKSGAGEAPKAEPQAPDATAEPQEGEDAAPSEGDGEAEEVSIPTEALPVEAHEILIAPGPVSSMAARIVRRTRCLLGNAVKTLRTADDLEQFLLHPCSDVTGLTVVAWARSAIWPYAQKVDKEKLEQLGVIQQALATVAASERAYTSFGWVPNNAPLTKNTSLLAFVNGVNAPIVAYICDESCRRRGQPLTELTKEEREDETATKREQQEAADAADDLQISLQQFPFRIFSAMDYMPKTEVREFIHVALSEFLSEVFEVASGGVGNGTEVEAGLANLEDLDAIAAAAPGTVQPDKVDSWCMQPIGKNDAVLATIIGEALSFDTATSKARTFWFYRSSDIRMGDTYLLGSRNHELPPQFGQMSSAVFDKLCLTPPTKATVILRANRHFNHSELPPRVDMHSTLRFQVHVLAKGDPAAAINRPSRYGDEAPNTPDSEQQKDYNDVEDPEAADPDSLKYVELSSDEEMEKLKKEKPPVDEAEPAEAVEEE